MFAHELTPGDTVEIHPRDWVTVDTVERRDSQWISNGIVIFSATNGHRYGLDRNSRVRIRA